MFVPLIRIKSLEEWLAGTNYTEKRKEALRQEHTLFLKSEGNIRHDAMLAMRLGRISKRQRVLAKFLAITGFIKREWYDVDKMPRIINSRSDMYKTVVGPAISSIEEVVFKLPYFIKHVPESERCDYIMRTLDLNAKYFISTDYRSFESTISADIMNMCEMQLYGYMLQDFPEVMDMIALQQLPNTSFYKGVRIEASAIRMSGEMNTSLGNGFTNLMLMMFMLSKAGCDPLANVFGIFEGDDGLTAVNVKPDVNIATRLGFRLDLSMHDELSMASFCGKVFDVSSKVVIADPVYYMFTSGWTFKNVNSSEKIRRKLQYVKGLSYMYQFAGSPVVPNVGEWLVRTSGYNGSDVLDFIDKCFTDVYEKDLLKRSASTPYLKRGVSDESRGVCYKKFGLHPQLQLYIESVFDNAVGAIDCPAMAVLAPAGWKVNFTKAVSNCTLIYDTCPLVSTYIHEHGVVDPKTLMCLR